MVKGTPSEPLQELGSNESMNPDPTGRSLTAEVAAWRGLRRRRSVFGQRRALENGHRDALCILVLSTTRAAIAFQSNHNM